MKRSCDLYLYNSLTREKELFTPLVKGHVGMYVCGPTVSAESHLGHARPFITFDILFRLLRSLDYRVRYVRNITDAGHFEEEGRQAEDKISARAVLERLEPMELTNKYTRLFHLAMQDFGCLPPSIEPLATGHIPEQIEMIEEILAKGFAYVVNGSVYFDVEKYAYSDGNTYGKLSGRTIDEASMQNARALEGQDEKRHKADFALWKKAPPEHIMRWRSPWGDGFPGWHVECSAMSRKYLGEQFDIHGGGMDLRFPHHESEIAQSYICNHEILARYWVHNNMITINGKKMGKSLGNVITLMELFSGTHPQLPRAYTPMTVRFFILQTHYRSTLDFSSNALDAAEKGLKRLMDAYVFCKNFTPTDDAQNVDKDLEARLTTHIRQAHAHLLDDLNTAKSLAEIFHIVPVLNSVKDGTLSASALSSAMYQTLRDTLTLYIEDILGLQSDDATQAKLRGVIDILIELRARAREKKDFATSDTIRARLLAEGITLKDGREGRVYWE